MFNKQRYITAGVTIAAAAVTAHMMQRDSGSGQTPQVGTATAAIVGSPAPATAPLPTAPAQNEVTIVAAAPNVPEIEPSIIPQDEEAVIPVDVVTDETPDAIKEEIVMAAAGLPETNLNPDGPLTGEAEVTFPTPPSEALMPAPLPNVGASLPDRVSESETDPIAPLTAQPERSDFGLTCGPILSASPLSQGLVNVTLTAPCRGEQRINIEHGPILFTAQTDKMGTFMITVPALMKEAEFTVNFEDGEKVSTGADVKDIEALDRVAIVARAYSGFQIHAREFGADYDEPGHIWAENPGDLVAAATDGGGFILTLGNPELEGAMVSEIYTFPREGSGKDGIVRLSVEAEVTARNCATENAGQTIVLGPEGVPVSMSMTVSMPDCDAIGEYLVLKNLLRDLRIASN